MNAVYSFTLTQPKESSKEYLWLYMKSGLMQSMGLCMINKISRYSFIGEA